MWRWIMMSSFIFEAEPFEAYPVFESHEREAEEEAFASGRFTAKLKWLPDNDKPTLFERKDAAKLGGSGVYIVIDKTDKNKILKVGKADPIRNRMNKERRYYRKGLGFYVANVERCYEQGCGVGGLSPIEKAIARTLLRAGFSLPWHDDPHQVFDVTAGIKIENILPKPLLGALRLAYVTRRKKTVAAGKRPATAIPTGPPYKSGTSVPGALQLTPKKHPQWEFGP
jgi:hypothetical protein